MKDDASITTEWFDAWPHDPTEIIREALREYVGDGDGENEKVLAAHDNRIRHHSEITDPDT